jgi:hypothetical protein
VHLDRRSARTQPQLFGDRRAREARFEGELDRISVSRGLQPAASKNLALVAIAINGWPVSQHCGAVAMAESGAFRPLEFQFGKPQPMAAGPKRIGG